MTEAAKAGMVEKRFRWRGEDIEVQHTFDEIIKWLDRFRDIGDQVVQYDPTHLALPWAGVRLVLKVCRLNIVFGRKLTLQIAVSGRKRLDDALIGTQYMAKYLHRCASYELIYFGSGARPLNSAGRLRTALIELYSSILIFLVKAKKYFEKNSFRKFLLSDSPIRLTNSTTKGRAVAAVKNEEDISKLLRAVECSEEVVRIEADIVEAECEFHQPTLPKTLTNLITFRSPCAGKKRFGRGFRCTQGFTTASKIRGETLRVS